LKTLKNNTAGSTFDKTYEKAFIYKDLKAKGSLLRQVCMNFHEIRSFQD